MSALSDVQDPFDLLGIERGHADQVRFIMINAFFHCFMIYFQETSYGQLLVPSRHWYRDRRQETEQPDVPCSYYCTPGRPRHVVARCVTQIICSYDKTITRLISVAARVLFCRTIYSSYDFRIISFHFLIRFSVTFFQDKSSNVATRVQMVNLHF